MTKIKLTVFVLIMLGASSCKQGPSNKDVSSSTIESPVLSEKVANQKEEKEQIIKPIEMAKDCNQTFDAFFERFAKDSVFQKNRVKYPLEWFYYKDVTDKTTTVEIVEYGSFNYVDFTKDKEAFNSEYDKYEVEIEKKENHNLYKLLGIDNGIHVTYKFSLIDDCWYLVEILDEST
ncbi:DUF4348 domain-containing protein [Flagellimonas sp. HMM57]|uniref:DUF4348 domain-containing protein n=1 Tax=unclassified Flagellimonas TaxID=2644544 RepID=UPI0013D2F80B|nr:MULTISPECIES: DUF4348 domain-containing protein [unclassified Flagellimonas]UII76266.1 DUF4348 domain-containing protein [Flagellimonas sp. HMM57]